ncbi:helix-turn-helix transcriptional regulator [Dyadobacter frigoris]|uniref:Helix-turn-helix transcriptional regulator n=1 Tax=Dyadobacter frigoris TaxID=2576211 RepID=A0A4U6D9Z9_9BACT|nr:helix-turn-helix transcriptional regulator [Dyadobacter frigoris]
MRNQKYLQAFGQNVRRLREEKNLSQEELYDLAGLSKNQVGNIERGEVNTTVSTAYAISKALNISVPELFAFDFIEKQ